jgi:hypothetical protein
MIELLSARDRRTLLVGVVSIGAIATVGKGMPAARRWQAAQLTRARVALGQEATAKAGAGSLGAVRDSASARARRLERLRSTLVRGSSPTAAAAALASLVERIAADHEVDVATVTLGPDSAARSNLAHVSVRVTAESDVRGLVDFLSAVESDRALLAVRELSLAPADPLAPTSRAETLRFEAVVESIAATYPRPAVSPRSSQ